MIFLFTDFGAADIYVGQVKAVLAAQAPKVPVIDLLHEAPPFNVKAGAHILAALSTQIPQDSVTLAVVDPGVGGPREAVAVLADGRWFVGPDNGLLSVTAARAVAVEVHAIGWKPERLSASFHGRDLFAPVAAHLAAGAPFASAGDPFDPSELVQLHMPLARTEGDQIVAHALAFDRFGNVALDVEHAELTAAGLRLGSQVLANGHPARYATTFADVPAGGLLLYQDAYRTLALAVNRGSAAQVLGLRLDDEVHITPV